MHDAVDLTEDSDHDEETRGRCPVCDQLLPLVELAAHCEAHFAPGEPQQQQDMGDPGTVHCGTCGACVPLGEYESHLLAHELEEDDLQAAQRAQQQDGEVVGALARQEEEALEQLYFQELRQRYGFEDKVRPGNCFLCGDPGHYARECSRNPATQAAQARVIHPRAADILSTQQPARCINVPGGLIPALAACLRQQVLPASVGYQALLCGPVDHYQGEQYDQGWGCGWRNLQMQASNLLAARQGARGALFGGGGFVPDIPALQAWLECAWAAGFDRQGAEQLEGRVQGTRKWVGTTEAATVLRYFGLSACIIDFGTPADEMAQVQALAAAAAAAGGGSSSSGGSSSGGTVEIHVNVECDGCGCAPIVGPRYRSQVLSNYDLCGRCYQAQGGDSSTSGPFKRMLATRVHLPQQPQPQQQQKAGSAAANSSRHSRLLQWVWDYFNSAPPQQEGLSAVAAGERALAGAKSKASSAGTAAPQPSSFQQGGTGPSGFEEKDIWIPDDPQQQQQQQPPDGGGGEAKRQRTAGPAEQRQQQHQGGGQGGVRGGTAPRWNRQPLPWPGGAGPAGGQQGPGQRQQQQRQGQGQGQGQGQQGGERVRVTTRPPLYFQHEGHSRTIVGIERRQQWQQQGSGGGKKAAGQPPSAAGSGVEYTLLILDPSCPSRPLADALQSRSGWQRMLKRGQHTLRAAKYQLMYCAEGLAAPGSDDYAALKIVAAAERYA